MISLCRELWLYLETLPLSRRLANRHTPPPFASPHLPSASFSISTHTCTHTDNFSFCHSLSVISRSLILNFLPFVFYHHVPWSSNSFWNLLHLITKPLTLLLITVFCALFKSLILFVMTCLHIFQPSFSPNISHLHISLLKSPHCSSVCSSLSSVCLTLSSPSLSPTPSSLSDCLAPSHSPPPPSSSLLLLLTTPSLISHPPLLISLIALPRTSSLLLSPTQTRTREQEHISNTVS